MHDLVRPSFLWLNWRVDWIVIYPTEVTLKETVHNHFWLFLRVIKIHKKIARKISYHFSSLRIFAYFLVIWPRAYERVRIIMFFSKLINDWMKPRGQIIRVESMTYKGPKHWHFWRFIFWMRCINIKYCSIFGSHDITSYYVT